MITTKVASETIEISSSKFTVRLFYGEKSGENISPFQGVKTASSNIWRGSSFFDVVSPIASVTGKVINVSDTSVTYRFYAELENGGYYLCEITITNEQDFITVSEEYNTKNWGNQMVWDFDKSTLPCGIFQLDNNFGINYKKVHYNRDLELCKLSGFTQFSQFSMLNQVDGFAVAFDDEEAIGFVALRGGEWKGQRLNFMEAWSRRWQQNDFTTRRMVPWEFKADGFPSPEVVPARGVSACDPHFTVEGYIGKGSRCFAIVFSDVSALIPKCSVWNGEYLDFGDNERLGHFDEVCNREAYRLHSNLLRRIHTQHGIMPIEKEDELVLKWDFKLNDKIPLELVDIEISPEEKAKMIDYLSARVYGFWEGSGGVYSNCVVGRKIARYMRAFPSFVIQGILTDDEIDFILYCFSYLSYLNESENYYSGYASMQPVGDDEASAVVSCGMANQNFYTDVICVFATMAEVFPEHPRAGVWRNKFCERLLMQLSYHVYPSSGAWEESVTYFQHVLYILYPVLKMRKTNGADDNAIYDGVIKMLNFALSVVTPNDSYFDGKRYLIPWGDHGVDIGYAQVYAQYADFFAERDSTLSGNLNWLSEQMGFEVKGDTVPYKAVTSKIEGMGAVIRGVDIKGVETMLALRGGSAWGHHHDDEGSLIFYAKGRMMLGDICGGGIPMEGARKFADNGHSRWTLSGINAQSYMHRYNRGWITELRENGNLTYATAYVPIFNYRDENYLNIPMKTVVEHYRTVVQLEPEIFLVFDKCNTTHHQQTRFFTSGSLEVRGNEVYSKWDDAVLRIKPLVTEPTKLEITKNIAKDDAPNDKPFITTEEVIFDFADSDVQLYLICVADDEKGLTSVRQQGEDILISRVKLSWKVKLNDKILRVTDSETRNEVIIMQSKGES